MRNEFFGSIKKHKVSRGEGSIKRHEVLGPSKDMRFQEGKQKMGPSKCMRSRVHQKT